MAKRVPPGKKAKKPERRSNAEGLIEFLRETTPRPELADAIERAYKERHRGFSEGPRGRTKRRRSTRTS